MKFQLLQCGISLLLKLKVNPEAHPPCSHTDTDQDNANNDIHSALIAHILTE